MIDIVTLSCNDSPVYWEFWNPVSRHWKQNFGIHPVLFYYGEYNSNLSTEHGTIVYQEYIPNVPDYVAATWGRFWVTKHFPNKMCLISDIDMFPLSRKFFLEQSCPVKDEYVHLNADAYHVGDFDCWKTNGITVPICYHLATSEVLHSVYNFSESYSIEMSKLLSQNYSEYQSGFAVTNETHLQDASAANGGMWGIDEMYSTSMLRSFHHAGGKVNTVNRILPQQRLCRSRIQYQLSSFGLGSHIDFHSLRPYSQHKDVIEEIVRQGTL